MCDRLDSSFPTLSQHHSVHVHV